jgi:hypothetical protein
MFLDHGRLDLEIDGNKPRRLLRIEFSV